eukprot:596258-Rhodomonas_salina.1
MAAKNRHREDDMVRSVLKQQFRGRFKEPSQVPVVPDPRCTQRIGFEAWAPVGRCGQPVRRLADICRRKWWLPSGLEASLLAQTRGTQFF